MSEIFDFGRYGAYIAVAYGVSVFALGTLIYIRWRALAKARRDEAKENK